MARPEPAPSLKGSFRLFQLAGVTVYLHWSWLLVGCIEVQLRADSYSSQAWNVAEYVALFVIVLLHEFGHALACRQVGGQANEIVLWPLGGIAFVSPPPRPGAWLWSIAAGPLVNVALVPVTIGAFLLAKSLGLQDGNKDAFDFVQTVMIMNLVLLFFNMLPIYPLDGGQILQALLWFIIGRAKSLMVVSVIGMAAGAAVIVWAVVSREVWFGILAVFAGLRSLAGFQQARILARIDLLPKHEDAVCPSCQAHPLQGDFWVCQNCRTPFDLFRNLGKCPECGQDFPQPVCLSCGQSHPIAAWFPQVQKPADDFEE